MTANRDPSRLGLWAAVFVLLSPVVPGLAQDAPSAVPARVLRLPAATVVPAAIRRMTETVPINGSLVARETVNVMPQVTGYQIVDVAVDVGDAVEKGAVLVRLDRAPLETQLTLAEAEIAGAEAAIAQSRSQISGQEALLTQADLALKRARRLQASGAGAQSVLDDAQAQFASATSSLQGARDALSSSEAQRQQSVARRDDIALQLSRTDVKAPVAGLVATRSANIGQTAGTDSTAMFTIIRNGEIEFDGQIVETAMGQVERGQEASLAPSGFPPRKGRVRLLSPNVDPKTRLGSVRISVDDDRGLPIGIFASARLVTATRDAVAVPLSAVVPSPEGQTVQIVDSNGRLDVRRVTTGIVEGAYVEISEGLAEGETVVEKSGPFFRHGMTIRPVRIDAKPAETVAGSDGREEAELSRTAPANPAEAAKR